MSKQSGTSTTIPTLSPEQNAMIAAQTGLFTNTIAPNYATATQGATNLYNQEAKGVTNAAQNAAGVANQAQNVLGSTGQSALTTGINALQNLSSPEYQNAEINAALQPAQAQYMQNIANQSAQFGGAGELGSARQALAQQQTAGSAQAAQEQAVAGILQNIAQQQQSAGTTLAQLGQSGLSGAQTAAANQISAAMQPQNLYNQYAQVLYGTPSSAYNPNFSGTQGVTTNVGSQGINLSGLVGSDRNIKENIVYVGNYKHHKLYEYNYKDGKDRYRGVMAQDVKHYKPEAVVKHKDGYLMVDYSQLGFPMIKVS